MLGPVFFSPDSSKSREEIVLLRGSEPARFKALVLMGLGLGRDIRSVSGVVGIVDGGSSVTGFESILGRSVGDVDVDVVDAVDAAAFVANKSRCWAAFLAFISFTLDVASVGDRDSSWQSLLRCKDRRGARCRRPC